MQNENEAVSSYSCWPMHVSVVVMNATELRAVYAALAGVSLNTISIADPLKELPKGGAIASPKFGTLRNLDTVETVVDQTRPETGTAVEAAVDIGSPEVDAHGHPWSELLHATTKGTTKDGLWRMKPGVTRPAAMPGFPIEEATSTTTSGTETQPAASVATEAVPTPATSTDEDDEFAAFRAADAATAAVEEEAVASIPARKWTDADLGKLCNQAAQKLGDPTPVKEIIVQFTPEGEVAHSRNIPEDNREDFAKAVEAKAGIEFAG